MKKSIEKQRHPYHLIYDLNTLKEPVIKVVNHIFKQSINTSKKHNTSSIDSQHERYLGM